MTNLCRDELKMCSNELNIVQSDEICHFQFEILETQLLFSEYRPTCNESQLAW